MERKVKIAGVFLLLSLCLAGCGGSGTDSKEVASKQAEVGSDTVEVKKDGVILNFIQEPFDVPYYDGDSLEVFIQENIARYNGRAGEERISLQKLKIRKEDVEVTMEYESAEDYSAFNGFPFFCGTVAEAYEAGYDLDVVLKSPQGEDDASVGKEQLLEMGSRKLIIAQVPKDDGLEIKTSGKILYMTGAELVKKDQALVSAGRTEPSETYIVFK